MRVCDLVVLKEAVWSVGFPHKASRRTPNAKWFPLLHYSLQVDTTWTQVNKLIHQASFFIHSATVERAFFRNAALQFHPITQVHTWKLPSATTAFDYSPRSSAGGATGGLIVLLKVSSLVIVQGGKDIQALTANWFSSHNTKLFLETHESCVTYILCPRCTWGDATTAGGTNTVFDAVLKDG